ncbi:hypothetical protein BU17DRAFT_54918 [Hysterangium stoloniferum]|nr:hypothetical protein BU17DRAFT_54918 [Hysterangium stoloniferum]
MAEEPNNDLNKALLVLNIHDIEQLDVISAPITTAAKRTRSRLLIAVFHPSFDEPSGTRSWAPVQKLLTHAYVQATGIAQQLDKILMKVDIILLGVRTAATDPPVDDWEMVFYTGDVNGSHIPKAWASLPSVSLSSPASEDASLVHHFFDVASWSFPVVALGGTFDHLHAGHKILLSMAAWITEQKIIVGVTDDNLLVKKAHREMLEPIQERIKGVHDFLHLFKPGLVYDIVPIADVYGPTAWDPNIQALVVSKETLPGAASIASVRAEKCLPPLQTFVIDVISAVSADIGSDDPEALKNAKMSSTFIREWIFNNSGANSTRN